MKCVFLEGEDIGCADLTIIRAIWKVDEETKKNYCTTSEFVSCPRFNAKMQFMTKTPTK